MSVKSESPGPSWKILLRLTPFIRPYRFFFILALLDAVRGAGVRLFIPYLLQDMADRVAAQQMPAFVQIIILAAIVFGIDGILTFVGRRAAARYLVFTIRDLRQRVTAHVQRLPMAFLETFHTGDLTSRLNADVDRLATWLPRMIELIILPLSFLGALLICGSSTGSCSWLPVS